MILSCNAPPSFADKSEAVWRRLVIVPFNVTIPAANRDPALTQPDTWDAERSGVLNWMLAGLHRLRSASGRFTDSPVCKLAADQHRKRSDPASEFLNETYTHSSNPSDRVAASDAFVKYQHWSQEAGLRFTLGRNQFNDVVRRVFGFPTDHPVQAKVDGKNQRVWTGLAPHPVTG